MERHQFLSHLHQRIRPGTYLEIGVDQGQSLSLSRVPSIGIDPDFRITREIHCDLHLARTSSDEFFARAHPLAHFAEPVIDLAFIDGMHLAEYVVRDFLAVERFTSPASVIVVDDVFPRSVEEANRVRSTQDWTGDVFKAMAALRELRPDLVVVEVDTEPTGVAVILCPDASRGGVLASYDEWLANAVSPDPQDVPREVLERRRAVDPEALLAAGWWEELAGWRRLPAPKSARRVRAAVAGVPGIVTS
jgi:predicted O-methyltransferase YrrM